MEDFACKDFNSEGDDESELIEDVRKAPLNKLPTGSATAQSSCTDNLSLYPLKNDSKLFLLNMTLLCNILCCDFEVICL